MANTWLDFFKTWLQWLLILLLASQTLLLPSIPHWRPFLQFHLGSSAWCGQGEGSRLWGCAAQHPVATCLKDKLEWMSRKHLSLFPIHPAITSLRIVASLATCKPLEQAGWGLKLTYLRAKQMKDIYICNIYIYTCICVYICIIYIQ